MKKISALIILILLIIQSYSQTIDTLIFCDYRIVPNNYQFNNTVVEEISGIEYAGKDNQYYLLPQSDTLPKVFLLTIEEKNNQLNWTIDSIIKINEYAFDGESVRLNHKTNEIFLSEELKKQSFISKLTSDNKTELILVSDNRQKYNRGWEGMSFDNNFENLYISLEQSYNKPITEILKYHLKTGKIDTFSYQLDVLPNDTKNDNGITEISIFDDSTLIILERDWQKSTKHTSVRVFKGKINKQKKTVEKIKCLSNFDDLYFKVDNIEGMTFNADKSKMIFVSDNNKNKHQQTQIICFDVK